MVKKEMSFKQISDLLDLPVAQLQLLNPAYKLNVVPFYNDENHYLRLPKEKIAVFASNEDKMYAYVQHELDLREHPYRKSRATVSKERINSNSQRITRTRTKYYKIRRGDNLGAIANKFDVKVSELKRWNKLRNNTIAYGKSLKIITTETIVKTVVKKAKLETVSKESILKNQKRVISELKNKTELDTVSSNRNAFYVVRKGDNLNAIAKENNITIAEIKDWNQLSSTTIKAGMTLQLVKSKLDAKEVHVATPELRNIKYTVRKGDNLGSISKQFGTTLEDLKEWNDLSGHTIALGSTLIVAKNEVAIKTNRATVNSFKKNAATISVKQGADYYVKKGDSLYSIAKKYPGVSISDLKKWNDIRGEQIKPGMKLKING
jgi:membrane-bound lytic murein transglycosylase D